MELTGKTALIAGASRNSGKAIAQTFARAGADLVLVAQKLGKELEEVKRECEKSGVRVMATLGDLSRPEEAKRVGQEALAKFGKVDVLLSTLGIRPHKNFCEFSDEEWLQGFAINLHSLFFLAKALVPQMIERKTGSIIALGGRAALTAPKIDPLGISSKHGLYGLIKSFALELGPHGIRANLLALSNIETQRLNPEWYPEADGDPNTASELERTPLRRFGKMQEVANVALFLASDASSYVTGDRVVCAGGKYM